MVQVAPEVTRLTLSPPTFRTIASQDKRMKVADYIAEFLVERQVPAVFELVGGMITFLVDAIHRRGETRIISMHHEQGAAFAAEAMGRMTGIPGVAMATSGPGATNLLTGIGSCYFDSTPAVFITGQVNRFEQKGDRQIRQLGFQETDIVRMVQPIVKRAWLVNDPNEVPMILQEAFSLAVSGRPGPVLIDIPMDVQRAEINPSSSEDPHVSRIDALTPVQAATIRDALLYAQKPLILAGGGLRSARVASEFRKLVNLAHVPVVHSLMAVDVLPSIHPLNAGMIGSYGNRWSNLTISEADVLLVLGSRLDVRQTGADTDGFKAGRVIFHIDCEAGEINNRVTGCHAFVSELAPALTTLIEALAPVSEQLTKHSKEWLASINALREKWPDTAELRDVAGINPNQFMHELSRAAKDAVAYVVDVGQHQMWAAQSIEVSEHQRFLTSGGMGSMGFALPAAIGTAVAQFGSLVVMIAGDGSFQCNIQELQTVARLGLPIKMVVINNQCHGMVRQFQQSYFAGRYQSTMWGYSAPDFNAVATAYGIPSRTILASEQAAESTDWLFHQQGPALLQVHISPYANAYPKLAFGKGMASMEPLVLSDEMEAT
jgi:acetolactate synthase I/II/III large subunit